MVKAKGFDRRYLLGLLVIVFLIYLAYPKLEVAVYTDQYNTIWDDSNFNYTINWKTNPFTPATNLCFRVSNSAEIFSMYSLPANNLKVAVFTNAQCNNCNLTTNLQPLPSQSAGNVCAEVLVPRNMTDVNLDIQTGFDALGIPLNPQTNFMCSKVGETNFENVYHCNKK